MVEGCLSSAKQAEILFLMVAMPKQKDPPSHIVLPSQHTSGIKFVTDRQFRAILFKLTYVNGFID